MTSINHAQTAFDVEQMTPPVYNVRDTDTAVLIYIVNRYSVATLDSVLSPKQLEELKITCVRDEHMTSRRHEPAIKRARKCARTVIDAESDIHSITYETLTTR